MEHLDKYETLESTFFERAIEDFFVGNPDVKKTLNLKFLIPYELLLKFPKDVKEQIKRISLLVRAAKYHNKLTANQIIDELPKEHKMTRAALNAYLYGTVKTLPTRDFLSALFKALKIPEQSINTGLEMCWYKSDNMELIKWHFARTLIRDIAREQGKLLPSKSIEKLTSRIQSMAELFVNEEIKEMQEGNKNEK